MSEATHLSAGIRGRFVLVLVGILGAYLICELGADLYDYWLPPERNDFGISERSDLSNHFDPIRGFYLTSTPSRFARIVKGEVEYIGRDSGNSVGFSDPKDFGPRRSDSGRARIAVFGDSYTAGNSLQKNWPSRVEELLAARGR